MLSTIRSALVPAWGRVEFQAARSFSASAVSLKKKAEKKIDPNLPLPPKGAASPYTLFFKEFYAENKHRYLNPQGNLQVSEVAKAAGTAWAELAEADKDVFNKASRASQSVFEKTYKAYYDALSPEQRRAVEKQTGKKLHVPGGKVRAKKELRDRPGNPGKPSSSFFEYLKAIKPELIEEPEMAGLKGIELHTTIAKVAGQRWRTLPEAEKEQWKEKTKIAREEYSKWLESQEKK